MKTTIQSVSVALDAIYQNACRSNDLQLTKSQLQKQSGVGIPTFNRLYQELVTRQLLLITGNTRSQRISWNTQKCGCNPVLVKDIYKTLYTVEVKQKRVSKPKFEYKEIVAYLRARGWKGILERVKDSDIIQSVERLHI